MQTPFEPWLLTAYLLGELDLEQTELVRQELEGNPALQSELKELRQAITKVKYIMNRAIDSSSSEHLALSPAQSEEVALKIRNVTDIDAPRLAPHSSVAKLKLREVGTVLSALAVIGIFAAITLPTKWSSKEKLGPELSTALNSPAYLDDSIVVFPQNVTSPIATEAGTIYDRQTADVPVDAYIQEGNTGRSMPVGSVNADPGDSLDVSELEAKSSEQSRVASSSLSFGIGNPRKPIDALAAIDASTAVNRKKASMVQDTKQTLSEGEATAYEPQSADARYSGKSTSDAVPYDDRAATRFDSRLYSLSDSGLQPGARMRPRSEETEERMKTLSPRIVVGEEEVPLGLDRAYGGYGASLEQKMSLSKTGGDRFEAVQESNFLSTQDSPLSTFSIDVDTASYSKIRQSILQAGSLPPANSVRIEELLNYFDYDYAGPVDSHPFASNMTVGECPWNNVHKLVRIGLQAKKIEFKDRPKANLVFLLDVSGSMDEPNKLPLVKQSIAMLVRQLGENDRISMVVYAGAAGCVLPSTTADKQQQILGALDELNAGGSTNGGQGIELAYSIAKEHFIASGINRVILCTDGDFNVGTTSDEALVKLVEEQAKSKVFLTCLGFGAGNYNDSMMEKISNHGNGIYAMIDNALEGRRVMIEQLAGSLMTVAKDVKIQIEFNPSQIASYRLIGYDNRRLANQDFNDDKKDAGEIGAGHRVTALYEVVLVNGSTPTTESVDDLRYRRKPTVPVEKPAATEPIDAAKPVSPESLEWLTLKLRYKQPEGDVSSKVEFHLDNATATNGTVDRDFQWAAAVAEFGLLLRRSAHAPQASWSNVLNAAKSLTGDDPYRIECLEMMGKAQSMAERR